MVIKGNARGGAKSLATHVLREDTNERVEVLEILGVAAEDIEGALREMEAVSVCTRTKKPFYHASINTRSDERLTQAQRQHAIDRLADALELTGQPRVVIVHEKHGREHCHIIWSRTDIEHGRAVRMDHNYRTHETVARELEREFGHARVQGAHVEREGRDRPARTPGHDEMQQAGRTGVSPKQARDEITRLWHSTDSGRAFQSAVTQQGWTLARGDRRDFVLIDQSGSTHSLSRRVDGVRAADVRARMADVVLDRLPSVREARAALQQAQRARATATGLDEKKQARQRPLSGQNEAHWTHRGGMAAQQGAALDAVKAKERATRQEMPNDEPSRRKLRFAQDRDPGQDRSKATGAKGGKRLRFSEDRKPDKETDRDR